MLHAAAFIEPWLPSPADKRCLCASAVFSAAHSRQSADDCMAVVTLRRVSIHDGARKTLAQTDLPRLFTVRCVVGIN
jgi:hypothetical protein